MKMLLVLAVLSSFLIVGCGSNKEVKKEVKQSDSIELEDINSNVDIKTSDDVEQVYNANLEAFLNKKKVRNLDVDKVNKETILEYSKKAVTIANDNKNNDATKKIDTVNKLVSIDDLCNNTNNTTLKDIINYVLSSWQSQDILNSNDDKLLEYLYITRYVERKITDNEKLKYSYDVMEDIHQVCKDKLRRDDSRMDANKSQIEKRFQQSIDEISRLK